MTQMRRPFGTLRWHGSSQPIDCFGGPGQPDTLHVGNLDQARMRNSKFLYQVQFDPGKTTRTSDIGSDREGAIRAARRKGTDTIAYLNRYEGIPIEDLEAALKSHPGVDLDRIPATKFRSLFPTARDSYIILDPARARIVDRFVTKGGGVVRAPAACFTFDEWIGKKDPRIIKDDDLGEKEQLQIDDARKNLRILSGVFNDPDDTSVAFRKITGLDGISFYHAASRVIAIEESSGAGMGIINRGLLYVEPDFRGRGVARMLHIVHDEHGLNIFHPSHFSTGGFAARVSAHRALCARAFERGDHVHAQNMESYDLAIEDSPEPV